jgi:renalase
MDHVDVVVVGAGIAGLACARTLADAGVRARVHERAGSVGGRLASRRFGDRYADLGAAYFVADDPGFAALAGEWRKRGLARPWTDTFAVFPGTPARGPMRWAAPGGLRSLAADLALGLDITLHSEISAVPDGVDAVVLAMPGPQAARLHPPAGIAAAAGAQRWEPVLTAVCTYRKRSWPDFRGAFVNDHPMLATVCDDGDRRGDHAPVLVAHSTASFARTRHATPADTPAAEVKAGVGAAAEMGAAVGDLLGIVEQPEVYLHHWPHAQPAAGTARFATDGRVWLAGDAFGRPRVQTAWLSGRAVAHAILAGPAT